MTSRHNETLQARRQALREMHKRELEDAKRRQAAQLTAITTFDAKVAKLRDAQLEVAQSVVDTLDAFGANRKEAAEALGLTVRELRDYLDTWSQYAAAAEPQAEDADAAPAGSPAAASIPGPSPAGDAETQRAGLG